MPDTGDIRQNKPNGIRNFFKLLRDRTLSDTSNGSDARDRQCESADATPDATSTDTAKASPTAAATAASTTPATTVTTATTHAMTATTPATASTTPAATVTTATTSRPWKRRVLVFALLLGAMLPAGRYGILTFHEANAAGRIYAVQSLFEDGTWAFNGILCRYGPNHTVFDLSVKDGQALLQKAPGISWLAIPAYGLISAFHGGNHVPFHLAATWLGILVGVVGLFAGACFVTGRLADRFGERAALVAVFAWIAGTSQWIYGPLVQDYAVFPALLVSAWFVSRSDRTAAQFAGGAMFGAACTINYMGFGYAAVLCGIELIRRATERRDAWRWAARVAVSAVPPVAALLAYQWIVFGSPFADSYDFMYFENHINAHANIAFSQDTLASQLFGGKHGAFIMFPWCLAGLIGLLGMISGTDREKRWEGLSCLAVILTAVTFTSIWNTTNEDSGAFSRHFTPAFPFLAVGLGSIVSRFGRPEARWGARVSPVLAGLIAVSVASAFVTGWTYPYHPFGVPSPWWEMNLPMFLSGIHVPQPVFSSHVDHAAGTARWAAVSVTALLLISAAVATWAGGRIRAGFKRLPVSATVFAATVCLATFASLKTDPLADDEAAAAIESNGASWTGTRDELQRIRKTASVVNKERGLAESDVKQSRGLPLDPGWKAAGYPETNPWCGIVEQRPRKQR